MTDIIAKPFDWNDNLSKEAIEDFEGIREDLLYCTCQNIGMALAKLELLEKQRCKVIDPSGSSSEKPNKSEIMTGWIPVSERLPEDGERVLATHLGGINPDRQVIEHIYQNGKFVLGWDMDTNVDSPTFGQRYMGEIIAWMPLPEPYKAESEE